MADQPRGRSAADTKKSNTKKGRKKKRLTLRRLLTVLFFAAAAGIICGIIGYLLIILNGERILAENQNKLVLPETSVVYDANGNEIATLFHENRENASFDEIPELLKQAVIATEDRRFEEHSGIDVWAIGRALVKDILAREMVEGGSTITQQLAKNLFLSSDKTILRKATEASIAVALENQLTKDEILEMYLNRIFFGKRQYGVKAAAEYYFGKELDELELWEIATLAGIPKAPSRYNPISNPELSKERRAVVLQLMYEQGIITEQEMNEAKAVDYTPIEHKEEEREEKYSVFVDYAIEEAMRVTGMTEEELSIGGYHIYTTVNPQAQQAVEKAFADDDNFEKSPDDLKVQGAMVIMDHRNGEIQGMAGARDYAKKGLNRVTVPRQPGSAFKPITSYGPALETGDWLPTSTLRDDKQCFGNYCPTDSNRVKYIGPVSMKQALKESRNLPAVWLLNEIGVEKGVEFANRLGFNLDESDRNLSIALGGLTYGVTPLQMAVGYSAFANEGMEVDAHAIRKIVNGNNSTIYEYKAPEPKRLMSKETAWYMTEMLQAVVQEEGGTGRRARIDRPVAGKTGTTQHGIPGFESSANRDIWFVGYTPEWTAAVWMGYDKTDREHVLKEGSGTAAAMFSTVMSEALRGVPSSGFGKPEGVKEAAPPSRPGGLTAYYDAESKSVKLSWNGVDGDNIVYRVYRKAVSNSEFVRLLDMVGATGAEDTNVAPGMAYQYYITAYDAQSNLESSPSDRLTVEVEEEIIVPEEPEPPITEEPPVELPDTDDGNADVPPDDGNTNTPGGQGEDGSSQDGTPPDGGAQTPGENGEGQQPDGSVTPPPTDGGGNEPPGTDDGNAPGTDGGNAPETETPPADEAGSGTGSVQSLDLPGPAADAPERGNGGRQSRERQ